MGSVDAVRWERTPMGRPMSLLTSVALVIRVGMDKLWSTRGMKGKVSTATWEVRNRCIMWYPSIGKTGVVCL